jgi:hypothetical protein
MKELKKEEKRMSKMLYDLIVEGYRLDQALKESNEILKRSY